MKLVIKIIRHKVDYDIITLSKNHNINNEDIEDKCNICNKIFNSRQSKWYHQKKCNHNELIIIKNEYKQLKDKIIELENNNTNIINNSNNNSNNN